MQKFRSATGVLVLSTALLIGSASGAIAAADTGTSDSTSGSSPARDSSADRSASGSSSNSVTSPRDSVSTSNTSATDAVGNSTLTGEARSDSGSLLSTGDDSTQSLAADNASLAADDAILAEEAAEEGLVEDSAVAVAALDDSVDALVDSDQTAVQSLPDVVSTATEAEVVVSDAAESVVAAPAVSGTGRGSSGGGDLAATSTSTSTSTASDSTAATAATASDSPTSPAAVTTTTDRRTSQDKPAGLELDSSPVARPVPLAEVFRTMTTVVVSLGSAAAAIPPAIWALPTSATPISDVIALLETIAASVAQSATAAIQLPSNLVSDLAAMLGVTISSTNPVVFIGDPSDHRLDLVSVESGEGAVVASPQVASPFPTMAPQQPADVVSSRSVIPAFVPSAIAALAAPLEAVPTAVPTNRAGDYESLFDRAFGALLVPLSLWALATGALPGLVGLLVVFGAGARVGYRQAKAGFAVKVGGIARFAGPGPLGVVRSGSLIALHQRGGSQRAARWYGLGDQVA